MENLADVQVGSKGEHVFNSKTDRFRSNTYLNTVVNPGPQDYDSREPTYIVKGPVDTQFGSVAERNSLLNRNVSISPFKNPTSVENPSPHHYVPHQHEMSKDFSNSPRQTQANKLQGSQSFINQQSS